MVYKTSDETMKISLKSRPRTFEGLVVEDIKELEKISGSQIPDRMKSFEGRPCTLSGLLLCCAEWQAQLLQQDLWQAASSGAPLHGLLTALSLVAAHPTGAEISILNSAEVERLVCLMERVVAHLLSVLASKAINITNFAPSFAEMAEAIDSTFCDILSRDEEEVMDITPAHQLVINCIWFNLKACCNLSSELASIESTASDIAERCGLLIVRVLKQCRHKGVIESAGMSLSNLIKMMTSNKCMRACHDLPERILTEFLDVLQEGSSAASVTRRCAGLAILVHKIVASDKQKNRPLLHLCVSRLLKIATDPVRLYSSDTSDLPSTQALHFLCVLVQDSALCQYVAAYMSDITQLCFKKLSSNIWTVRNAALQLFGALVPKLVGEKKNNDENMIVMCGLVAIHIQHSYNASSTEEKITLFLKVVQVLSESCNPQSVHEDFRLSASVSLQLLALTLKSSKNSELIELKKLASVRAESYDTDIEYVLQLLGKEFDQDFLTAYVTDRPDPEHGSYSSKEVPASSSGTSSNPDVYSKDFTRELSINNISKQSPVETLASKNSAVSSKIVTPEKVGPHPKAPPRKTIGTARRTGKSSVLTDKPVKTVL
uniref:DUF2428 domain-containing protein n=1 Tax=Timema cristinae TaxID=61476 RepID=A0A7R9C8S1_TIMCR|nr:unnamed protein product [Timema cristinae]